MWLQLENFPWGVMLLRASLQHNVWVLCLFYKAMKRQINENLWGDLGFAFAKCLLQAVMLVLFTSLQSSVCIRTHF